MLDAVPTIVVFGLNPEGRPRAARFAEPDAELAIKAASRLGYRVVRISDAEILEALPAGNVFARGNGFIGRVSRSVLDSSLPFRARYRTRMPARRLRKRGCGEVEFGQRGPHPCP
jgi:hypothetical protein